MKRLVIPTLLALLIVGCSSTPDADQAGAPVDRGNDGKVGFEFEKREPKAKAPSKATKTSAAKDEAKPVAKRKPASRKASS